MCDLTLPLVFKLFAVVDYMKEKGNLKMINQELQTLFHIVNDSNLSSVSFPSSGPLMEH